MRQKGQKEISVEPITKDQVLALDIATHCGYFSMHEAGTWNFEETKRRNDNKQHKHFRDTLIDFIQSHGIKAVVIEDINVNNHFTDMRKLAEFRGILFEICDSLDLPEPDKVNVSHLKKFATGDGRADKKKMIEFCKIRWKYDPPDDNAADACHIYYYYIRKHNIT